MDNSCLLFNQRLSEENVESQDTCNVIAFKFDPKKSMQQTEIMSTLSELLALP